MVRESRFQAQDNRDGVQLAQVHKELDYTSKGVLPRLDIKRILLVSKLKDGLREAAVKWVMQSFGRGPCVVVVYTMVLLMRGLVSIVSLGEQSKVWIGGNAKGSTTHGTDGINGREGYW